ANSGQRSREAELWAAVVGLIEPLRGKALQGPEILLFAELQPPHQGLLSPAEGTEHLNKCPPVGHFARLTTDGESKHGAVDVAEGGLVPCGYFLLLAIILPTRISKLVKPFAQRRIAQEPCIG